MNVLSEPVRLFDHFNESKFNKCCENNNSMYPEAKVTQPAIIETIQTKPFPIRGKFNS